MSGTALDFGNGPAQTGGMGSMKVTVNLAMRARDVSRPRPEHLAEAAAREDSVPRRVRPAPAVQPPPPPRRRKRNR